eukprot:m.527937 g.527937  ORF g.527937 m.527937 type:complete len:336 (+) comp22014_c1_seq2:64-1071(+)
MWRVTVAACVVGAFAQEPNPPKWDESTVKVFSPGNDAAIQQTVNDIFAINGGHDPANHGQFSPYRFAFLFKPGTYAVDVPVGFYTQVMGMGMLPSDVKFTGVKGVFCEEGDYNYAGGALDTFWRSAENFATSATYKWIGADGGMMWAVSQASPIRRVEVNDNLFLYEYEPPYQLAGYSSGGFMANIQVNGTVEPGSQQQFFARNCDVQQWTGGMILAWFENQTVLYCSQDLRSRGQCDRIYIQPPATATVATLWELESTLITKFRCYYLLPPRNIRGRQECAHVSERVCVLCRCLEHCADRGEGSAAKSLLQRRQYSHRQCSQGSGVKRQAVDHH